MQTSAVPPEHAETSLAAKSAYRALGGPSREDVLRQSLEPTAWQTLVDAVGQQRQGSGRSTHARPLAPFERCTETVRALATTQGTIERLRNIVVTCCEVDQRHGHRRHRHLVDETGVAIAQVDPRVLHASEVHDPSRA